MVELTKSVVCCAAGGHATHALEEVVDEDEQDGQEGRQDSLKNEEEELGGALTSTAHGV